MSHKHFILTAVLAVICLFIGSNAVVHAQVSNAVPGTTSAQNSAAKPVRPLPQRNWSNLTERQQIALKPLQGKWSSMDGARQRKMLALAERFHQASPDQQARMHERMQAWVIITPEERQRARENFKAVRKVESQARNEKWSRYEQLPVEQRVDLHSQVEQRRANSPVPRTALPAAQGTNAQQPPAVLRQALRPQQFLSQGKPRVVAAPGLVDPNTLLPLTEPIPPASKR